MSGGYFDYQQYRLNDIADAIERLISNNREFDKDTLYKFGETITVLRKAEKMVQRIDWLVSGDDSEETFHERWAEELGKL